jgi:hypothetical protein
MQLGKATPLSVYRHLIPLVSHHDKLQACSTISLCSAGLPLVKWRENQCGFLVHKSLPWKLFTRRIFEIGLSVMLIIK